ncbi:hypothetical protein HPB50_012819 [Hyalomma asiaticum]|uniref:Uncharacterized protein n=1 Tax=Hyalomma asiaticum TaxID=266040 RepID=A0ACB7SMF4_HYAAI|nr:hypothetical protein HPB50_012819 [Hyalomma asiaticum]
MTSCGHTFYATVKVKLLPSAGSSADLFLFLSTELRMQGLSGAVADTGTTGGLARRLLDGVLQSPWYQLVIRLARVLTYKSGLARPDQNEGVRGFRVQVAKEWRARVEPLRKALSATALWVVACDARTAAPCENGNGQKGKRSVESGSTFEDNREVGRGGERRRRPPPPPPLASSGDTPAEGVPQVEQRVTCVTDGRMKEMRHDAHLLRGRRAVPHQHQRCGNIDEQSRERHEVWRQPERALAGHPVPEWLHERVRERRARAAVFVLGKPLQLLLAEDVGRAEYHGGGRAQATHSTQL